MAEDASDAQNVEEMSLLARKLRASRPGQGPVDVSEEHAIRLAMARAGRKALGRDALVTSVARAHVGIPADLGLSLSSKALVSGLQSTEGDQGVVAADASIVDAVTSLRTTGILPKADAEDTDKTATTIQAVLMRPFLTTFLLSWAAAAFSSRTRRDKGTGGLITGYSIGNPVANPRTLLLSMPLGEMIRFTIMLELGGRIAGEVLLAFPVRRIEPAIPLLSDAGKHARETPEWTQNYRNAVLESPAALTAILHRMPISLDEINALREGSIVVLPTQCLENVMLEPKGSGPQLRGRLGQINGSRALRLNGTVPARSERAQDIEMVRVKSGLPEETDGSSDHSSIDLAVENAAPARDDEATAIASDFEMARRPPSSQDL